MTLRLPVSGTMFPIGECDSLTLDYINEMRVQKVHPKGNSLRSVSESCHGATHQEEAVQTERDRCRGKVRMCRAMIQRLSCAHASCVRSHGCLVPETCVPREQHWITHVE